MNKHQKKIYKLTKIMYQLQTLNNPSFDGDFFKYYKKIKWLYGGRSTSKKELEETFEWSLYVLDKSTKNTDLEE